MWIVIRDYYTHYNIEQRYQEYVRIVSVSILNFLKPKACTFFYKTLLIAFNLLIAIQANFVDFSVIYLLR